MIKPPTGLSPRARRLWRDTLGTWKLDPDGVVMLETACKTLTRLENAERIVTEQGMLAEGSQGQPVAHPMLAVIDRERTGFLRAMRQLGLETSS